MKLLKTFSGQEFVLEDEEAENVVKIKSADKKAFLELRCGSFVDTSAIETIGEIPLIAYSSSGCPLSKDGRSYMREGSRVWVEDFGGIIYKPDPKYKKMLDAQLSVDEQKLLN